MEYLPPHPPAAKDLAEFAGKQTEFAKYSKLADSAAVDQAKQNLEAHKIKVTVVANKNEALKLLQSTIPKGASTYHAASTSLWEIGWEDYLRNGDHGLVNVNSKVRSENDQAKRNLIRMKEGPTADYAITSVDAITQDGQLLLVDSSGTRTGPFATAAKVIVVAGTHKIVPTLADGYERVNAYSEPVERARLAKLYGPHLPPTWGYTTTFSYRSEYLAPERVHVVLVPEAIGH